MPRNNTSTDITIPKPPKPFKVDANGPRLARIKNAARLEREAEGLKLHGYITRAAEVASIARHVREEV